MVRVNKIVLVGLIGALVALMLNGCTQRLIDFTIISSKNVAMKVDKSATRVHGKDEVVVFLIPFGIPNLKEAVDRAIESAGPGYDALIDGVVSQYNYHFIVGVMGFKVEGTPIKSSEIESISASKNILYHSFSGVSNEETLRRIPINILTEEESKRMAQSEN